jgi:predicted nucleotidyltransferase
MPSSSRPSAGATYLNRESRIADLRAAAERARQRMPSIDRIILFGSLAKGSATPRSDADLLVVVRTSEHTGPRDRVPELLDALDPLPCPVDLHVLTIDEFNAAQRESAALVREALAYGINLL